MVQSEIALQYKVFYVLSELLNIISQQSPNFLRCAKQNYLAIKA